MTQLEIKPLIRQICVQQSSTKHKMGSWLTTVTCSFAWKIVIKSGPNAALQNSLLLQIPYSDKSVNFHVSLCKNSIWILRLDPQLPILVAFLGNFYEQLRKARCQNIFLQITGDQEDLIRQKCKAIHRHTFYRILTTSNKSVMLILSAPFTKLTI